MPSLLRSLVLLAPLATGCSSKWSVVDGDGDGVSLADGDCWDAAEGPPGSSLTGAEIYPGAPDEPYDGFDADCAGNDDYDLDGDGFVTDAAHVGQATYAVPDTGLATADGDCWDNPNDTPEAYVSINGFDSFAAADVYPGAVDVFYDAVDSACDGGDEFDADADGFTSSSYPDRDGNTGSDCFDLDEPGYGEFSPDEINIDAQEVCGDEVDNDCDALIDADDSDAEAVTWYIDVDGDEYGDIDANELDKTAVVECDQPKGFVLDNTDCDDAVDTTFPTADEYCDKVDNDCNAVADDDYAVDAPEWYSDSDSDGYGDPTVATVTCYQPSGYVSFSTDCDDTSARTYPGAAIADSTTDCMKDEDADGYGDSNPPSGVTIGNDCDDGDGAIFPGATEGVGDEVDQDCDTNEICYVDADDDTYRLTTTVVSSDVDCTDSGEAVATDPTGECDDTSATTYPGAAFNESSSSCRKDDDGDGYGDDGAPSGVTDGDDCDDGDSAINPAAGEITGDEVDQDCDTTEVCYVDADDDTYRLTTTVSSSDLDCTDAGEALATDPTGECDDTSDTTYPGAAFNESSSSCRKDDDGDGYGDDGAPSGVTDGDDCDDDDSAINPAASERTGDEVDQDCDTTEVCYVDDDDDGYRLTTTVTSSDLDCTDAGEATDDDPTGECDDTSDTTYPGAAFNESASSCRKDDDGDGFGDDSPPSGVTGGGDCDDGEGDINPDATEGVGDEIDQDCDTNEACYVDADDDGYRLTTTVTSSDLDCTDAGEAIDDDPTGECDDTSDTTYPGAAFNESASSCRKDDDGDGYGDDDAPSGVTDGDDCDDTDSAINPSESEITGDEVDQDCDGDEVCYVDDDDDGYRLSSTITSADIDCTDAGEALATDPTGECDDDSDTTFPGAAPNDSTSSCMKDDDGDDYGDDNAPSGVTDGSDCDDDDSDINPSESEITGDEVDQDCDTNEVCFVDADDDGYRLTSTVSSSDLDCTDSGEATDDDPTGECDDSSNTTFPGAAPEDSGSACMKDDDGDDYGDDNAPSGVTDGTDCDDTSSSINPDGTEGIDDGVDQDCDGDEVCYVDDDDDGYRLTSTTSSSDLDCTDAGEGESSDPTGDCDDTSADTFPGAAPNDDASDCMLDADGDDYGDSSAPSGVTDGSDCDDDDNTVYPTASEGVDDGVDQDCDGDELCYVDADDDSYRLTSTTSSSDLDCTDAGEGESSDPTGDCDDTSADTFPGAAPNDDVSDCMLDADGDGYGDDNAPSGVTDGTDCDDTEDYTYPGADPVCFDGTADNDCDGAADECELGIQDLSGVDTTFQGTGVEQFVGHSVQLGDLTGDGTADVFIGARGANSVYMFESSVSDGTLSVSTADAAFTGDSAAGFSIAPIGDVDGDGNNDIVIGDISASVTNAGGAAYLVLGPISAGVDLTSAADAVLHSTVNNAYAGYALGIVGDQVTSDGSYDILIGAPNEKDGGDNPGVVYIHYGISSYSSDTYSLRNNGDIVTLEGEDDGDFAGSAVAGVGDLDGDTIDDIVVGATGISSAYVLLGPVTDDGSLADADYIYTGSSDELGSAIAAVGDLDSDGYDDFLLGAPTTTNGTTYLYYGGMTALSLHATLTGDSSGDEFGTAMSVAGDINDDGDDDLLISALFSDTGTASSGSTYVFHGPVTGSVGAASADAELYGNSNGDQAGRSVAGGHDLDADGRDDFLIGAHFADPGSNNKAGEAYLIIRDVE